VSWARDGFHLFLHKKHKLTDMVGRKGKLKAGCFVQFGKRAGATQLQGIDVVLDSPFLILLVLLPQADGTQLGNAVLDVVEGHFEEVKLALPGEAAVVFQARYVQ
jgi:hypothetical protein